MVKIYIKKISLFFQRREEKKKVIKLLINSKQNSLIFQIKLRESICSYEQIKVALLAIVLVLDLVLNV